jgi:cyclopropane fatty-acyl-phospholipid synthase-like methyltransferase
MTEDRLDKNYIDQYWRSRAECPDPRVATHYKHDDALEFDVALARKHLSSDGAVLDLGCGTGAMVNRLAEHCSYILGVDKVHGLLKHCRRDLPGRVACVEADVVTYTPDRTFDLVLLFGVVNFLTASESDALYARIPEMLGERGRLIVKHACGVSEEVVIDKFSEAIGTRYVARYPKLEEETARLHRYFNVEVVDIYPARLNPWPDTHFYAFVCGRSEPKG